MNQCRINRVGYRVSPTSNLRLAKNLRLLAWLASIVPPIATGETQTLLTLEAAEHYALQSDPAVIASQSRAVALQDQAIADGQLPDPKLGLGVYNLPLNDFSVSREPTTQLRSKIQQSFPRGHTLHYQQKRTEWLSKAETAQADVTEREIQRDLRQTFFELYYQKQAAAVVARSRDFFQNLVEITRAHFATGRVSQQNVLQAQLELSRLDEKATHIDGNIEEQQGHLTRWLGDNAWQPIDPVFPALPGLPPLDELRDALKKHPAIQTASAKVEANQQMIKAAREQYKPGWNVGLEYRKRFGDDPDGSNRDDMMAAMVTVDLPLFTEKRQDKRLTASRQNTEAAIQLREQRLRELRRTLETDYAQWKRLSAQETLYQERLVPEASDSAAAALNAYQSGTSEFDILMRARITELDIKLNDLRVRVDRAKAQARLLYLLPASDHTPLPVEGTQP
jgi:outer membrane protein TolC